LGTLISIEQSAFAEWVRVSAVGYPLMITSHAIGMGVMVGLTLAFCVRLLGWSQEISYSALNRFWGIAWAGFGLNFVSGTALFTTQATSYVESVPFLLKLALIFVGVVTAALLQAAVTRDADGWGSSAPAGIRALALVSIASWTCAVVSGRLIAYY